MSSSRRVLACFVAGALLLGACSNTESPVNRRPHSGTATATVVNGVQQVRITAGDLYRFSPSTIVVHPGMVRIVLVNTGTGAPHNWTLSDFPADFVPAAGLGRTRTATFIAPSPGKYQFVCTFHARQGQTGTLVVEP
jgi:plastocyanin